MGDINDWADLCPQTICWQSFITRDQYGAPSYQPAVTFAGRRVFKVQRVAAYERGTKGQGPEALAQSTIWILGTPNIGYEDLVYVLGDSTIAFPPVLSIQNTPDEDGPLFVKVMLGSSNG